MECLRDYIGISKDCTFVTSLSGKYITQLPGIEIANIDGIADAEQQTFAGVWADLQNTTIDTFREDVIAEFGKRYMLNQITQTLDLGQQINTAKTYPNDGIKKGILIENIEQSQFVSCSNMQQTYIQSVNFYWQGTNGTPTLTLYFIDGDLKVTEYSIVVSDVVSGWNSVWIDRGFAARRLHVLASGNFDNYVSLDISNFNLDNFGGYMFGQQNNWLNFNWGTGCQSRVRGATYDPAITVQVSGQDTYGMSIVFNTKCNFDTIVCNNKQHFASAFQHLLALELMNYRINSSRLNRWTTTDKKQAIELQKLLSLKYRGGMDEATGVKYPGKLQQAIESIVLNDADCCIKSNDYIIWRETRM